MSHCVIITVYVSALAFLFVIFNLYFCLISCLFVVEPNVLMTTTRRQEIDNDKMLTKGILNRCYIILVLLELTAMN